MVISRLYTSSLQSMKQSVYWSSIQREIKSKEKKNTGPRNPHILILNVITRALLTSPPASHGLLKSSECHVAALFLLRGVNLGHVGRWGILGCRACEAVHVGRRLRYPEWGRDRKSSPRHSRPASPMTGPCSSTSFHLGLVPALREKDPLGQ